MEVLYEQRKHIENIVEYCNLMESKGMIEEAEYKGKKVTLNKPMRGDVKKYKVYVKNPKTGKIIKVNFGDKNMEIRRDNAKRRKSFRARHKCETRKDRTKASYWSCKFWSRKPVSDLLESEQDFTGSNIISSLNKLKRLFALNAEKIYNNWLNNDELISESEVFDMISEKICEIIENNTTLSCIVGYNDEEGEDISVYVYDPNGDRDVMYWIYMPMRKSKFSPENIDFIPFSPERAKDLRPQNRMNESEFKKKARLKT
jgi:hypothetical protein